MKGDWTRQNRNDFMGLKWSPMLVLSVVFHLAICSLILFLPESMSTTRRFEGMVYEVDLVEMPGGGKESKKADSGGPENVKKQREKTVLKTDEKAKRIPSPKREEKPVVIAKRTVSRKTEPKEEPKVSPSDLIDKAISKLEDKVKTESKDQTHLDQAISKIEDQVGTTEPDSGEAGSAPPGGGGSGRPGGQPVSGIAVQIYQMEVEGWIKSNWSYPVALQDSENLEAVVLLVVKRDGAIQETQFKKRSSSAIFDQSVSKAIERSNPLPPFPESYRKSQDEIEITFNLKDLAKG